MEAGHPGDVGGSIQEVLFSSFAVQADSYKLAFVFFHHHLEVRVGQVIFVL